MKRFLISFVPGANGEDRMMVFDTRYPRRDGRNPTYWDEIRASWASIDDPSGWFSGSFSLHTYMDNPQLREAVEAAIAAWEVPNYLRKRGYNLIELGNGRLSWVRIPRKNKQIVVTGSNGHSEPTKIDWLINCYASDEWIDGLSEAPEGDTDKTLSGFIAALDRVESHDYQQMNRTV